MTEAAGLSKSQPSAGPLVPPAPGVAQISAYIPGPAKAPGVADPLRLASNEAALGPSPAAAEAARAAVADVMRYPEPTAMVVRRALGDRYGLDPDQILCGAGSEALIHMIMRAYISRGDELIAPVRAFSVGKIAAMGCGAHIVTVEEDADLVPTVDALLAAVTPRTRMLYLPNPNNPTGTILSLAEVERLRAGLRDDIVLLIDAAYRDYVADSGYGSGDTLVTPERGNVVVTGTFSKSYALAGLRIGWLYAPRDMIRTINLVRPAFNVTTGAQAAAAAALGDEAHLQAELALARHERARMEACLAGLGFSTTRSHGNFVLATLPQPHESAVPLNDFLVDRGVLVRPVGGYALPRSLRITLGLSHQNDRVLAEFEAFLTQHAA